MPIIRHGYATTPKRTSNWAWTRTKQTLTTTNTHCGICNQPLTPPTDIDHITPRSHGGTDHPTNLRRVHRTCNRRRGAGS